MNRIFHKTPSRVDEENPYWISFSDLMSGLLIIFILAAVALIIELTQTQKKIEQDIEQLRNAEQARRDILHEIRDELARQNIVVIIADNDTVLRIPDNTLTFAPNSYNISNAENITADVMKIGEALHRAINKPFHPGKNGFRRFEYLDTVFIEGHTDSRPTSRVKGNWGLSSFRSISLWDFWQENLSLTPQFSDMTNAFSQKLFSMSGYAASRRVQETEETGEQRQRNRRIDIRFTLRRPSIAQLEEIIQS